MQAKGCQRTFATPLGESWSVFQGKTAHSAGQSGAVQESLVFLGEQSNALHRTLCKSPCCKPEFF